MVLFIISALIVGFLCWLILLELCKCTRINDTSKVNKSKVTDISTKTGVPTKADIEQYNNQIYQQKIINDQNAEKHIIAILDVAYKDYINKQIKNNRYINCLFILDIGDYGLTFDEIYAIRDNTLSHGIYKVEYRCESSIFRKPYLIVTVNN